MSLRLFTALTLPDTIKDELLELAYGVPGARWMDEDQLHLTLRFIGDVDGAESREISAALARIRAEPFELQISGVGFFPPRGPTRVLWAGVAPCEGLEGLHKRVDLAITRLGHKPTRRRWAPHITLARLDGAPSSRIARFMAEHALVRGAPFLVTDFHLISSHLHPRGAVYTLEETFSLGLR